MLTFILTACLRKSLDVMPQPHIAILHSNTVYHYQKKSEMRKTVVSMFDMQNLSQRWSSSLDPPLHFHDLDTEQGGSIPVFKYLSGTKVRMGREF